MELIFLTISAKKLDKNELISSRVHSLCFHEEPFRLTPVPDKEEELESSRRCTALGESKILCYQSVNRNPLLCLNGGLLQNTKNIYTAQLK